MCGRRGGGGYNDTSYKDTTSSEVGWGADYERVFYKYATSREVGWMKMFDMFSTNVRPLARSGAFELQC